EFLRHVERCAGLVHVIDMATWEPNRDPVTDLTIIETELAAYAVDLDDGSGLLPLSERPKLVALNKVDIPDGRTSPISAAPNSRPLDAVSSRSRPSAMPDCANCPSPWPNSCWPSANAASRP